MAVWSPPLQNGSEGSSFISRTAWRSRTFLTQHHHGSLPQQLGVVWDLFLKTDPEGPTLISHAAYPHDWSVHDELLSVCACSTLNPRKSNDWFGKSPRRFASLQ